MEFNYLYESEVDGIPKQERQERIIHNEYGA